MQKEKESTGSGKELYEKLEQQNKALKKLMKSIDEKLKVDTNSKVGSKKK